LASNPIVSRLTPPHPHFLPPSIPPKSPILPPTNRSAQMPFFSRLFGKSAAPAGDPEPIEYNGYRIYPRR